MPKFEKYLVHKDQLKPIAETAFYYDQNLARKFYNVFWDNIKDTTPITEVFRHYNPTEAIDEEPKEQPSSLILPAQLGLRTNVQPFGVNIYKKMARKNWRNSPLMDSDSSTDDHVSQKTCRTTPTKKGVGPTPEDVQETFLSSPLTSSDETLNEETQINQPQEDKAVHK